MYLIPTKIQFFFTVFFLISSVPNAWSTYIDLGAAGHFNTFIFEDFQNTSDTQGRLAVGGNACLGANCSGYSVGTSLNPPAIGEPSLIVGGNLDALSGSVRGNVVVGGTDNHIGALTYYPYSITTGAQDLTVNFNNEKQYLTQLSTTLSHLAANGSVTKNHSRLDLVGDNQSELQIFNLNAAQTGLSLDVSDSILEYLITDTIADATIVINVAGEHINFSNGHGFSSISDHLLFNFYEATTISLSGGFWGSILAPLADLSGSTGHIEGTLIANQMLDSSIQQNYNPFISYYPTEPSSINEVPEPYSILLFGIGLILLFRFKQSLS